MIRSINSLLYRAYLKKNGLSVGLPDEYYTLTEDINSFFYTFSILKVLRG